MIMQGTPKVTLNHNICNMEKKVTCGIGFSIIKNINKYLIVSVFSKSFNNYLRGINFNHYTLLLSVIIISFTTAHALEKFKCLVKF